MIQDIAPHRYDITYRKPIRQPGDPLLVFNKGRLLCRRRKDDIRYPLAAELNGPFPLLIQKTVFLFRIDEQNFWGLPEEGPEEFGDYVYLPNGELRSIRPIWKAFAGVTGFHLYQWYTSNRFCGYCGTKMQQHATERAMLCPCCGQIRYPQICPSVIVAITYKDRLLMTKYASGHSAFQKYALVAGYVEAGESLEDAVRRETMEEVGLTVKNIRYYKSQPWGFSYALLAGFFCEADGSPAILIDREELSFAEWFSRGNLPRERSEPAISLTGEMIEVFETGKER